MARFPFWRCCGVLILCGAAHSDAADQVVRDRNGDPWVVSIRPGTRHAGLPKPGITKSVPAPVEMPLQAAVVLPEPPLPGKPAAAPSAADPQAVPPRSAGATLPKLPPAPGKPPVPPVPDLPPVPPPVLAPKRVAPVTDPVPTPAVSVPAPEPTPANPPAPVAEETPPPAPNLPSPVLPATAPKHELVIVPGPSSQSAPRINGRTYQEVYNSIPFSYTEYLANPAYRHETTMEILFGQLRPTTGSKDYTPQTVPDPMASYSPYRPFLFAHPEQWIYRYTDYRYQWYLTPQITAPYGVF